MYSELTSSVSMVKPGGRGPSHDSIWRKSWCASSGVVTVLQMVGGDSIQTHTPGGPSLFGGLDSGLDCGTGLRAHIILGD